MSKEENFLSPHGGSLRDLAESFMDKTTDLYIKTAFKVLDIETSYMREKNMEKKLKQLKYRNEEKNWNDN